jgi:hypothetical protein
MFVYAVKFVPRFHSLRSAQPVLAVSPPTTTSQPVLAVSSPTTTSQPVLAVSSPTTDFPETKPPTETKTNLTL